MVKWLTTWYFLEASSRFLRCLLLSFSFLLALRRLLLRSLMLKHKLSILKQTRLVIQLDS